LDIGTYEVIILQEVQDESDGCGPKFRVVIVSDKFEGKPLLQRHRYKCWLSFKNSCFTIDLDIDRITFPFYNSQKCLAAWMFFIVVEHVDRSFSSAI